MVEAKVEAAAAGSGEGAIPERNGGVCCTVENLIHANCMGTILGNRYIAFLLADLLVFSTFSMTRTNLVHCYELFFKKKTLTGHNSYHQGHPP
jgi:hypothetical protein